MSSNQSKTLTLPKLVFITAIVVLIIIAAIALQSESSPSAKTYAKIHNGMNRADVENVFGRKNGALGDAASVSMILKQDDRDRSINGKPSTWANEKWQITVWFDAWGDGAKVVGKQRFEAKP